jgi:hypothetical protein
MAPACSDEADAASEPYMIKCTHEPSDDHFVRVSDGARARSKVLQRGLHPAEPLPLPFRSNTVRAFNDGRVDDSMTVSELLDVIKVRIQARGEPEVPRASAELCPVTGLCTNPASGQPVQRVPPCLSRTFQSTAAL